MSIRPGPYFTVITVDTLSVIRMAEEAGLLHPHTGSRIFEGTVGSTGISIATMARALGYEASALKLCPLHRRHLE